MAELTPDTPSYEAQWKTWKAGPTPEATSSFLQSLNPVIERAAGAQVGRLNPLVRSQARVITLKAIHTYDPKQGKLQSHLFNHMQGLKRYSAQIAAGVHVPERVSLDRRAVTLATQELHDELGYEPTDDQLADHIGLPVKRIQHVRRTGGTAMSQGFFDAMGEGAEGYSPAVEAPPTNAWERLVVGDLNPIDQKILQFHRQGLTNQAIAGKLRLSPGRVSQRKQIIQQLLDKEQALNPF